MSQFEQDPTSPSLHEGWGVYVHFPWCLKKCPYCDFLSVAVKSPESGRDATRNEAIERIPHAAYADAVIREAQVRVQTLLASRGSMPPLRSIFFGGGTPSLWEPEQLGRVMSAVFELFNCSSSQNVEVTVECNPTSVDLGHFQRLAKEGVNRVSIGVQGLNPERLRFLGRLHNEGQAVKAIVAAQEASIPRVSADLIYGVFRQTPAQAVEEVTAVAQLGVDHMSAYMLTVEDNTRFGALHRQGKLPLLDEALVAESYKAVSEALSREGFEHYEVSNFARSGMRSVHNEGYWVGRDYLGLGTGAYGTVSCPAGRRRYRNWISPERYVEAWTAARLPEIPFDALSVELEEISPTTSVEEALLLGLRRLDGIDLAEVARLRGSTDPFVHRSKAIGALERLGKLKREGNQLVIPQSYWLFADQIIRDLL